MTNDPAVEVGGQARPKKHLTRRRGSEVCGSRKPHVAMATSLGVVLIGLFVWLYFRSVVVLRRDGIDVIVAKDAVDVKKRPYWIIEYSDGKFSPDLPQHPEFLSTWPMLAIQGVAGFRFEPKFVIFYRTAS